MTATATQPAESKPDAMPKPTQDASPPAHTEEVAVRWLARVALHGRPRRAIAAFRTLTVLCEFYRETHDRIVELSRTGRPAVAAAAAAALVEATLARRRHRDGRSPLLRL